MFTNRITAHSADAWEANSERPRSPEHSMAMPTAAQVILLSSIQLDLYQLAYAQAREELQRKSWSQNRVLRYFA